MQLDSKELLDRLKNAGTVIVIGEKAGITALIGVVAVVVVLISMIGALGGALSASGESFVQSTYLAADDDIRAADSAYSDAEEELRDKINNIAAYYPGYDEYRVNADEIVHDPYCLTAYLTAVYKEYKFEDVRAELGSLFNMQYILTLTPVTEVRVDPDGNPYNWKILNVTLQNLGLEAIVTGIMTEDERKAYDVYMANKGNRGYLFED